MCHVRITSRIMIIVNFSQKTVVEMNAKQEKNAKGKCAVGYEHFGQAEAFYMSDKRLMMLGEKGVTELPKRPTFVPCTPSGPKKPNTSSFKGGRSRRKTRRTKRAKN